MSPAQKYYWSEEQKVYHDNSDCPSGQQILEENRTYGFIPPIGRGMELCEHCKKMSS